MNKNCDSRLDSPGAQSLRFRTNLKFCDVTCGLSHKLNKNVVITERSPHTARFRAGRIVGQPANTGSDNNSIIAVMNRAQQNSGSLCIDIPGCMFSVYR